MAGSPLATTSLRPKSIGLEFDDWLEAEGEILRAQGQVIDEVSE